MGKLIRVARNTTGRSQEDVAREVGKQKQLVSSAERDRHVPPLDLLVRLHEMLYREADEDRARSLGLWIVKWIEALAKRCALDRDQRVTLAGALNLLEEALAPHPSARMAARSFVSLEDFPAAVFQPLTIIAGDRRETSENRLSLADLFAYSVSITDMTYLPLLPAMQPPPKIHSDKLVVVMDPVFLRNEFGSSHLLIVGSPAVNWAARIINRLSLFRFDIDPEWVTWDEQLRLRPELKDEQVLRFFWRIAQMVEKNGGGVNQEAVQRHLNPDGLTGQAKLVDEAFKAVRDVLAGNRNRFRYIMNKFRKSGLLDPADGRIHGEVTRDNNDFAVISLAPNPFDPTKEHVAILVAGVHGPGTTHALRILLEEPGAFKDHPFGGVLEVHLPRYSDWSSRLQRVTWEWQTEPYEPAKLKEQFAQAEQQQQHERTESLRHYLDTEIEQCSKFISRLVERGISTGT